MAKTNANGFSQGFIPPGTDFVFPPVPSEFRTIDNGIEGKVWFELDVSRADTIVIIQDGKRVEIDKKEFLQRIGLEW